MYDVRVSNVFPTLYETQLDANEPSYAFLGSLVRLRASNVEGLADRLDCVLARTIEYTLQGGNCQFGSAREWARTAPRLFEVC